MTSDTSGPTSVGAMSAAVVNRLDDVGNSLLRAAGDLLTEEGAGALTVRRIAAAAGVSTMNVYSRFGGKDGVVEHLFLRGFELLAEAMREAGNSDDPMDDLRRCGQAYRRFALEHATLYAVMFQRVVPDFEPSAAAQASAIATLEELAARLQRAVDHGMLRPIEPMHAASILWATCHGVVVLEMKGAPPGIDWPRVFDDATAAVLRGLAP